MKNRSCLGKMLMNQSCATKRQQEKEATWSHRRVFPSPNTRSRAQVNAAKEVNGQRVAGLWHRQEGVQSP